MTEKRKPGKFPSERGRNYTPLREVVHCALPGVSPLPLLHSVSVVAKRVPSAHGNGRRRTNVYWTLCALRTADDFRRFPICPNHHRGSCPVSTPLRAVQGKRPLDVVHPCAGSASYPFVDLPTKNFSESLFHLVSQGCIIVPAINWYMKQGG